MIPDAAEIVCARHRTAATVRLVALIGTLMFVCFGVRVLTELFMAGGFPAAGWGWARLATTLGGAAAGGVLFLMAPWISRWCVRPPGPPSCPKCIYNLQDLPRARCPECGLVLTTDFLPTSWPERETRP